MLGEHVAQERMLLCRVRTLSCIADKPNTLQQCHLVTIYGAASCFLITPLPSLCIQILQTNNP